jgi:hypothetical protein
MVVCSLPVTNELGRSVLLESISRTLWFKE